MAKYDMSWSNASTTTGFYGGTNYTAADLGGFTGSLAMGHMAYLANKKNTQIATDAALKEMGHETDSEGNPLGKDPLSKVENFLVGMYESICGGMARIRQGVSGVIDSVSDGLSTFGEYAGNFFSNISNGEGLHWENNDERKLRHYSELLQQLGLNENNTSENTGEVSKVSGEYWKKKSLEFVQDAIKISKSIPGYIKHLEQMNALVAKANKEGGLNFDDSAKLMDSDVMGQNVYGAYDKVNGIKTYSGIAEQFLVMFKMMKDDPDGMIKFDQDKQNQMNSLLGKAGLLEKFQEMESGGKGIDLSDKDVAKALKSLNVAERGNLSQLIEKKSRVESMRELVKTWSLDKLVSTSASASCNLEAYWGYGVQKGKEDRNFMKFYVEELNKGNIGQSKYNLIQGQGNGEWADKYQMNSANSPTIKKEPVQRGNAMITQYQSLAEDSNDARMNAFMRSSATRGVIWYRPDNVPNADGGKHFADIMKKGTSIYILDHAHGKRIYTKDDYGEATYGLWY
ncbi:MAG: hypothetical protein KA015_03260 [Spirochaetes bacterium]|nr:hypothetical protein [Spirochaetota bacterium]